jgi:predicted transcriptional regulator
MSPRAAWRLEVLGFAPVFDYVTGKVDWRAAGLPTLGTDVHGRVLQAIEADVPTCRPNEPIREAVDHAIQHGWDMSIAINHDMIVQGRVRLDHVGSRPEGTVADHMDPGPATIRADANLIEMRQRMTDRHVSSLIVSTPEGRLLGAIRRV